MKTLILLFHQDYDKSHANRALVEAAGTVEDVDVVDMSALYPDHQIDLEVEAARLFDAERLVLQFPIQWYSTPPLLKAWQDQLLTRLFYINPKDEGERLRGMPLLVAATAGNEPEAYHSNGVNLFPLLELLRPLQSTAHRCAFTWQDPFLVYRANKSSPEELASAGRLYAKRLTKLAQVNA